MTIVLKTDGHSFVCRAPSFRQCQVEVGLMILATDLEMRVFDEFTAVSQTAKPQSGEPSEYAVLTIECYKK